MNLTLLLALSFGLVSSAHAAWEVVGGTVENRKTEEVLALMCDRDANTKSCKSYQFAIGYMKGEQFEERERIGRLKGYSDARDASDPDTAAKFSYRYERVQIQSLTAEMGNWAWFPDIVSLWVYYVDPPEGVERSLAGEIWRGVLLTVFTPVIGAFDVAALATAGTIDGVRIAGEAAVVGPYNLGQKVARGFMKRRMITANRKLMNGNDHIKVSDNVYQHLIFGARGGDYSDLGY